MAETAEPDSVLFNWADEEVTEGNTAMDQTGSPKPTDDVEISSWATQELPAIEAEVVEAELIEVDEDRDQADTPIEDAVLVEDDEVLPEEPQTIDVDLDELPMIAVSAAQEPRTKEGILKSRETQEVPVVENSVAMVRRLIDTTEHLKDRLDASTEFKFEIASRLTENLRLIVGHLGVDGLSQLDPVVQHRLYSITKASMELLEVNMPSMPAGDLNAEGQMEIMFRHSVLGPLDGLNEMIGQYVIEKMSKDESERGLIAETDDTKLSQQQKTLLMALCSYSADVFLDILVEATNRGHLPEYAQLLMYDEKLIFAMDAERMAEA